MSGVSISGDYVANVDGIAQQLSEVSINDREAIDAYAEQLVKDIVTLLTDEDIDNVSLTLTSKATNPIDGTHEIRHCTVEYENPIDTPPTFTSTDWGVKINDSQRATDLYSRLLEHNGMWFDPDNQDVYGVEFGLGSINNKYVLLAE